MQSTLSPTRYPGETRFGSSLVRPIRRAYWKLQPEVNSEKWIEVNRLGLRWRLDLSGYIGQQIVRWGIFEKTTTRLLCDLAQPGMRVLDVGANIGYYAALLSRAVGSSGKVWAFEPVARFRESLRWHLEKNRLDDCVEILDYGLSDTTTAREINLGNTSATFHLAGDDDPELVDRESVSLRRLDDVASELGITRLDLIKSDIDGHEPFLFRGAEQTLKKYRPILVLEVAEHCLQSAGASAAELGKQLTDLGYVICSEATRSPYTNQAAFLAECGSLDRSANILAVHPGNVPGGISL